MRLFTAIVPPSAAITHLAAAVQRVRDDHLRWTDTTAWHVTLAFYGDVEEAVVPKLVERLTRAARRYAPMELQLAGSGRFSRSVLWIGVHGERRPLGRLASSMVSAGRRCGIPQHPKRTFRPHVTIARAARRADLRPYVSSLADYSGPPWEAEEAALIQSHLGEGSEGHPRYETIARFPLGA
ncbi:RNA 2',3'-cyclic phosphodiesterase [Actinobacteria bacterium YIM 96077]|uniref:RNA 2',3'-cyclic phosphodiesterase n=1 Tax=Phytoactinopolyspora halophila TaxID=1981511 RepID=A0A329R1Y2_9ACTN|nr:RNA 2',3'-cyclic phosphodiesterase [Phytoactinopolyspora halophila]AYY11548.1 RNA 2',3'-cyclic phosphodiesterase [Actinobacteria bacterium YIM 96077]RAW17969.1 RNA 2',3'-cyclic phosphodiesterase [Phytoactinopolyspora halophila]